MRMYGSQKYSIGFKLSWLFLTAMLWIEYSNLDDSNHFSKHWAGVHTKNIGS